MIYMENSSTQITLMTITDELFLPTRLVYEVYDANQLRAWLKKTTCVEWHPVKLGWTWNYDGAAIHMGFPLSYAKVPKAYQPLVLATGYLVDKHSFHVYTRCGLRTVKFLEFFDQQVPRTIAMGQYIDQYNLITSVSEGEALPFPEDYFKDESKLEFFDLIGLLDSPDSPEKEKALYDYESEAARRTLRPLERHRLEAFYDDGPKQMEQGVKFREMMAMLQTESSEPIRPVEVISRILSAAVPKTGKVGRNDPCSCGSGKKFKKCCGADGAPSTLH